MDLLSDRLFYEFLLRIDADLADATREAGCPRCGGRLHGAKFPRKPRGAGQLPDGYESRFSFCCANEGCRGRVTPPSMRFLGRRVYLGAVVVLASAMQHGVSPTRAARLLEMTGASLRTLARWRRWWTETFATGPVWKLARALLRDAVSEATLPLSLLGSFRGDERERLLSMLRLLLPLTGTATGAHAG